MCLGAHIVDTLGRPVTDIPPGQGQIRVTAAGTAAGTAVDLAKLGADVVSMGPIGDDRLGGLLVSVLREYGIDTTHLARKPGAATPATTPPIRPDGEPHAPGAMAALTAEDVDLETIAAADALHVGGPDVLGAFTTDALPDILRHAHDNGVLVTMDLLGAGGERTLQRLVPGLEWTRYFMPDEDQLRGITGRHDLGEAAAEVMALGVECVAVTLGAEGSLLVTADGPVEVPALDVPVVDTTGCGDAYAAGMIVGLLDGRSPTDAARLGTAAAALVATGLGADAGIVDLASAEALLGSGGRS